MPPHPDIPCCSPVTAVSAFLWHFSTTAAPHLQPKAPWLLWAGRRGLLCSSRDMLSVAILTAGLPRTRERWWYQNKFSPGLLRWWWAWGISYMSKFWKSCGLFIPEKRRLITDIIHAHKYEKRGCKLDRTMIFQVATSEDLHPWKSSKAVWKWSWATCYVSLLEQGHWTKWALQQRSLLTPTTVGIHFSCYQRAIVMVTHSK